MAATGWRAVRSFELAVSAIVLHNLPGRDKIFECYRAIHDLLAPERWFLNYDRFLDGVSQHMGELLASVFAQVERIWHQSSHALLVAGRPAS